MVTVRRLSKLELRIMDALWSRGPARSAKSRRLFPKTSDRPTPRSRRRCIASSPNVRYGGSEDQQRPHFRGRHIARRRASPDHRRAPERVRRPHPAGHGAPHRSRETDARRPPRGGEDIAAPDTKGALEVTIATHLLQSTVCVGIAALLAFALRRAPARTRHAIWLFASVKFLVPFSLFTAAGAYFGARASALTTPSVSVVVRWLDQSLSFWGLDETRRGRRRFSDDRDRLLPLALVIVWASGVVGLTVWRWRQWRDVSALARALPRLEQGREADALERRDRNGSAPSRIVILRCRASVEPGVLGVLRPKLLWPDGLSDRLTDAELESILAHEVCHVGRLDNLSALLHVVVETLFWFHPAVWWVGSRLVTERERACDEEVLHMGADNRSYAEGILKVCNFGLRSPVAFVAGVGGPRADGANRVDSHASERRRLCRCRRGCSSPPSWPLRLERPSPPGHSERVAQ